MNNYILIFLILSTVLFSKPIYKDDETVDEARAIIEKNIISNPKALEFDFGELDSSDLERVVKVMKDVVNKHTINIKEIDKR